MNWIRLLYRLTTFILFLLSASILALVLKAVEMVRRRPTHRAAWASLCFRKACWCLGFRVQVHGQPVQQNALVVANHISWSDIPVLGALAPVRFLSKSEVAQWPVIGWLARQGGTLFIKRGGRQARSVKADIGHCLSQGESVLVFPEGTTSCGVTVLPMHGLLLLAAREKQVPIQPVSIGYRRDNRPDTLAPFIGDDSFHKHLFRLLKQPPTEVHVMIHPPVEACTSVSASALAEQVRQPISEGLTAIHSGILACRQQAGEVRTTADPGSLHLPSLAGGPQSPDRNTA